jgi:hypothetical protein
VADHKVRDGVLRILVTNPITSGARKYFNRARVFETTDGSTWTEVFTVYPPLAMMRFTNFDWSGDDFYLTGENEFTFDHDSGQPPVPNNQKGAIYRVSLAASGTPRAQLLSGAAIRLSWINQAPAAPPPGASPKVAKKAGLHVQMSANRGHAMADDSSGKRSG